MLANTVLRTIQRFNLFLPGETPLIAVSGGADSVALLLLLKSLATELEILLHIATFDHMLREEFVADITWVEQLAIRLSIPVSTGRADVRTLAKQQAIGIEAAARQARYEFLADTARKIGAKQVVTGHHADDQAETVLMHILRGSGMQGLQGMDYESPLPGAPDLLLIRPLLEVPHDELVQYCRDHDTVPRVDESNFDTSYLRNRIRLEVLPQLGEINPNISQALARIADISRSDHAFIESVLQGFMTDHVHVYLDHAEIDRYAFRNLHPALQRRCIYTSVKHLNRKDSPTYSHIVNAVEVASTGKVGAIAEFPGHLHMRIDYDVLIIEHSDSLNSLIEGLALLAPGQELAIDIPGHQHIPGRNWSLEVVLDDAAGAANATLACPDTKQIILRGRRPGDRFQPLGMHGKHQKIKDWMINRKIPRNLRDRIPLVVMDGEIAAVIYGKSWAISERFVVRETTQCVLKLFVNFS